MGSIGHVPVNRRTMNPGLRLNPRQDRLSVALRASIGSAAELHTVVAGNAPRSAPDRGRRRGGVRVWGACPGCLRTDMWLNACRGRVAVRVGPAAAAPAGRKRNAACRQGCSGFNRSGGRRMPGRVASPGRHPAAVGSPTHPLQWLPHIPCRQGATAGARPPGAGGGASVSPTICRRPEDAVPTGPCGTPLCLNHSCSPSGSPCPKPAPCTRPRGSTRGRKRRDEP